jgi:hypothetical protein
VPEYVRRLHPDVVVNSENCVSARFSLLKPEMHLREKKMQIVPCHITPDEELPDTWSHLLPDIGLHRFLIVIMFELRRRPCRLLPSSSKRVTFGT